MLKKFLRSAGRMRDDEQGSVFIIVAFGLLALVGSTGVAVDMGRINLAQSRLSKSLDSAGLAAGATLSTSDVQLEARRFFDANYQNYMDSTITEFAATPNADNTIIALSVTATLPMSIMKVFGRDDATITASTEITRETSGLELVMVLDNTGSMAGSKLSSLKTASHDLINILFGDGDPPDDLWVGMVPFSQSVNVGDHRTSWIDSSHHNNLDWGPNSQGGWGGCVDARTYPRDINDDPPSCLLYTSPSPRDQRGSRMPSSA